MMPLFVFAINASTGVAEVAIGVVAVVVGAEEVGGLVAVVARPPHPARAKRSASPANRMNVLTSGILTRISVRV
jgi:hypothetical protein